MFPVKEFENSLLDLIERNEIDIEGIEDALPDLEEIAVNTDTRDLHTPKPPEEPQAPHHVEEKNANTAPLVDNREEPSYDQVLHNAYLKWTTDKTTTRAIKKPNAGEKLWKKIQKRPSCDALTVVLPPFDEGKWLTQLQEVINNFKNRRLTIVRLHFLDPTITPIGKVYLENLLNFLSNKEAECLKK